MNRAGEGIAINFAPRIFALEVVFLSPKPGVVRPFFNFLKPFMVSVWLLFFFSLLIAISFTYLLLLMLEKSFLSDSWTPFLLFMRSVTAQSNLCLGCQTLSLHYFQQLDSLNCISDVARIPKTLQFKVLFGFWLAGVFFLVSAYECNLRAYLIKVSGTVFCLTALGRI